MEQSPANLSPMNKEIVFLIHQFLQELNFKETIHKLEKESGLFFNMNHFGILVLNGEWDEVEKYLSGFTKVDDNRHSMKIFFEIRKQKYLEALDMKDHSKALGILVKDLKVFKASNAELFKEITQLLAFENFRENKQLSAYGEAKSARTMVFTEVRKLIEANPLLCDKLQFPTLKESRLHTLLKQSNSKTDPDIETLFHDHTSSQSTNARDPPRLMTDTLMAGEFPQVGVHQSFPPATAPLPTTLAGWIVNPSPLSHPAVPGGSLGLATPLNAAAPLKRRRTPPTSNPTADHPLAHSDHLMKRSRPIGISDKVGTPTAYMPVGYTTTVRSSSSSVELPKSVAMTLNLGSAVMSMDFHPSQPTLLLVGTNVGDTVVLELLSRERLALRKFEVWDLQACSLHLQESLVKDPAIVVNCVRWSPDGHQFGVAYSKHIVHMYTYNDSDELIHHLEIEAHAGGVNDLAFSQINNQMFLVTCGDDKAIKVWDAVTGVVQYKFEGHEAPVYSVCPHSMENIPFILSTSFDGKMKGWLYEKGAMKFDYNAPGHCRTSIAYSADGTRLFSCGTDKDGESYLVEWNESKGSIKRTYLGLRKHSMGCVVQFDTAKNRFLAAADEFKITFWEMDIAAPLASTDAEGGLEASPCIRYNKVGSLLAVSTNDNCIKILANADGIQMLLSNENLPHNVSKAISEPAAQIMIQAPTIKPSRIVSATTETSVAVVDRGSPVAAVVGLNGDGLSLGDVKLRTTEYSFEQSKIWNLTEISGSSQCRSLRLPDKLLATKVSRLTYTNSGLALLALTSNAVHKLWKWKKEERNVTGRATASFSPQLWQPSSGILMTNEINDVNPEAAVSCFTLSKNSSYLVSTSGGKISLFNMVTFKTITTFLDPPPAATSLAFHPQDNNIVAIGMEDSSIKIYNVRLDELITKLRGHNSRITGLAFSTQLNVLVSSGTNAQMCVWSLDGWKKQASTFLQIPRGRVPGPCAETLVQFNHIDQRYFLAVHETHLALYEASQLECIKQWLPRESDAPITHATYSGDCRRIYSSFMDGSVCIFTAATLQFRCRINPTAYLHSNPSPSVHPVVVAANPLEPEQFALGLSDGSVHVLEPLELAGEWGAWPKENCVGVGSSFCRPVELSIIVDPSGW